MRLSARAAWEALGRVPDPELPLVSITELGIVRDLEVRDDAVHVVVTPTYAACPATELIDREIERALAAAGAQAVRIERRLAPAWSTDWIAPAARARLKLAGIAPPGRIEEAPVAFVPRAAARIACPRCNSTDTERLSEFGATACKALYRCRACREPFEYFKPI
ncbi:MAG TPA: 1,2-phenylacetyl-CoA epoxidase subunit PaaD [Burkholderiaceae bacterium]|nr:1,2-phenylacetyl-CoA epoxidase subunit PaaD [Burkholderiaceae bacterium]